MRIRQHNLIFLGMLAGAGLGLLLSGREGELAQNVVWFADLFGTTVFIGALKMIVAPLIFFSILAGITSLSTKGELWGIGWRTLLYYFTTTSIAVDRPSSSRFRSTRKLRPTSTRIRRGTPTRPSAAATSS